MADTERDKQMIIGTGEDGIEPITLTYATSAKVSPEIKNSSTTCFGGTVVQGSKDIPYNVETEQLRYDEFEEYIRLSLKLEQMLNVPDNITLIETVHPKSGDAYKVITTFFDCVVDDDSYEIKADENTVETFKFKAAKRGRVWENLATGQVVSSLKDLEA